MGVPVYFDRGPCNLKSEQYKNFVRQPPVRKLLNLNVRRPIPVKSGFIPIAISETSEQDGVFSNGSSNYLVAKQESLICVVHF